MTKDSLYSEHGTAVQKNLGADRMPEQVSRVLMTVRITNWSFSSLPLHRRRKDMSPIDRTYNKDM